jgi:hypothetical protein
MDYSFLKRRLLDNAVIQPAPVSITPEKVYGYRVLPNNLRIYARDTIPERIRELNYLIQAASVS